MNRKFKDEYTEKESLWKSLQRFRLGKQDVSVRRGSNIHTYSNNLIIRKRIKPVVVYYYRV